ncbi:hypothetical protein EXIGLDRAFT_715631 [Exidia glandulosa HHB12029]|uniref:ATP-dependent DNA helicase n=1 Tax=Exidia glandulosa HHB12029 TaxID=1314781 RepID=A0A165J3S7_EXIGL|nr:hypothetical protein EXIGLDRAFT_715631 [Exidia glandulosa HHB12029]
MWLGTVPSELKDLSYVEKMLVARSRHHKCIARVSKSGMGKLTGNLICYPNPYPVLINVLPPHRDDIDDMLAIVFTGVARPTDEDKKRIPFAVRRNKVRRALDWLKRNNISDANLNSFEDGAIPTVSNNPVESRAANDNDNSCPFAINGVAYDFLTADNLDAVKATTWNHMIRGGSALAVPHGPSPDTLWHNPDLFPNMFPWLFPYGVGGVCNARIQGGISEHAHKRHLLMYHDKRFQHDREFALVAFNQEQILSGSRAGAFLSTKSKFNRLVDMVLDIDHSVFGRVAEKLQADPRAKPETDEEMACFRVLSELDMVNAHVPGSVTAKRYQRNELWSLLSYMGAPTWFITFAPTDINHPICLYLAGDNNSFEPAKISLLSPSERWRLIAHNAVASARFFHLFVKVFIEEILKWDDVRQGLFGDTNAFYGTVEQQGRLTLHLHLLLWIRYAISPEEIKRRLLDPDSDFQLRMVAYLDDCHRGHLFHGTMSDDVRRGPETQTAADPLPAPTAIHPTQTLPVQVHDSPAGWAAYERNVDDLLRRTNYHKCDKRCWTKGPKICKSRFPRKLIDRTHVDPTGYIHVRHDERRMNTVNPTLSYLLRCNSDVTCLLSGTALKAVIAYATDYITKVGLKTPTMFNLIRMQMLRHAATLEGGRKLIIGIVNSFTSKSEIGAPMAASYLLDLPDHYASHEFKTIYWKGFVSQVLSDFAAPSTLICTEAGGAPHGTPTEQTVDYNVVVGQNLLVRDRVDIIAISPVDDYMRRPSAHFQCCMFDWVRLYKKSTAKAQIAPEENAGLNGMFDIGEGPTDQRRYHFTTGHPQYASHTVCLDSSRSHIIPNFVGGSLPRLDVGDREYYCCTMLTFFKPWRTGRELKGDHATWDAAFDAYTFTRRQLDIMTNFNLRDDYSKLRREDPTLDIGEDEEYDSDDSRDIDDDDGVEGSRDMPSELQRRTDRRAAEILGILDSKGWMNNLTPGTSTSELIPPAVAFSSRSKDYWSARLQHARSVRIAEDNDPRTAESVANPIAGYRGGRLQPLDLAGLDDVNPVDTFELNTEQSRAFNVIAGHFVRGSKEQMNMYVGGMAGTGKSQVIKALTSLFVRIGARRRLLLLAPTGTAAANIGGYTYHSAFGLNPRLHSGML